MSITKGEIAQLIRSMESGGQAPSNYKISEREIIKLVDSAFGYVITKHYWSGRNEGEDIDGSFISAFPDTVVYYDSTRDEYFFNLPAKIIKLPGGNDKGLRQVSGNKGQKQVFIKVGNGSAGISSPLESSGLLGKIGYYLEGEKVFFVDRNIGLDGKENGKIRAIPKVLVKQIASIDAFDEDDVLPIPGDMELELIDVVRKLLQEMKQTPVDDYNDGHSK